MRFALLLYLFFIVTCYTMAQERCGTVPYNQKLKDRKRLPKNDLIFENWLQQKIREKRGRQRKKDLAPYKIPVVVHVVHNGESIGTGTNISDAQILSQISVLNKDFQRLNADASSTPSIFVPLAGSMDIEFVLAKQDPEGLPTNGIVRVLGSQNGWTANDNYELKSQSYWPSEDYLNIWVCDLIDDLVGYAQLPESSILSGLENSSNNALTDGVVIWYKSFGSIDDGPFDLDPDFNKGRTVTHEVGHIFGLRHIWGDDSGGCGATDYVDDTPNQAGSTRECPDHPRSDNCTSTKMFQNYMDYTDDVCMNLFTQDQIERMSTVIENSPRRESLLTSHGLQDPVSAPNDLGIRQVISPTPIACSTTIIPALEVRNYGNNTVTSSRIELSVNGSVVETKNFVLTLTQLGLTELTFTPLIVNSGDNTIAFTILQTNGGADGNGANNELSRSFFVSETITPPFIENFNTLPSEWIIQNPDELTTWQLATAPNETQTNTALFLNFADYEESYDEFDVFLSPVLDLSAAPAASLTFDLAYVRFASSSDSLRVIVLKNCEPLANGTIIYDKGGATLATTTSSQSFFIPSGPGDWRHESFNLNEFIGESQVQIAFVSINDWGNNLYLDNIAFTTSAFEDIVLANMVSPSLVTCHDLTSPIILVQNAGTVPITTFKIESAVNSEPSQLSEITLTNALNPTKGIEIILPEITLQEGINSVFVKISQPNGVPDETLQNNEQVFTIVVNAQQDRIPLRENFDAETETQWIAANPEGGTNWNIQATNFGKSMFFQGYSNNLIGEEAWLVSPVLDFSGTSSASMVFDVSSASRLGRQEILKVYASDDCGNTYEEVSQLDLTPESSNTPWEPVEEADWQKDIVLPLNNYAGEEQVRVAFVITNKNGNNVFIDNIEFFTDDVPDLIEIEQQHSVYGYDREDPSQNELKVTFNLTQRQDVPYAVVDMMGKLHADGILKDVLNQTYPLELEQKLKPGIYIIRMKIGGKYVADRVIIAR